MRQLPHGIDAIDFCLIDIALGVDDKIAHEIVEKNPAGGIALVGIHRRGAVLACRLQALTSELLEPAVPLGDVDISFYRDDYSLRASAPVVHALRGKEFIEYDNPFDVGLTGLLGFSSGYHAMMACDVLLMIGSDFPYRQFFPGEATIVQIDVRGEQLGRRTKVDLGLVGDAKTTLRALLPILNTSPG